MAANVTELTDTQFDDIVHNSSEPVLVDFWAPWCGPCKMQTPVIKEIADEYVGKAKICELNTDEHQEAAIEFGINAIPTVILFNKGQIAKKWVGLVSKANVSDAIDELLG